MEVFVIISIITILGLAGYGFQIWSVRAAIKDKAVYKGTGPEEDKTDFYKTMPAISVLKPLKGLDGNLFDNLESICNQDYPEYEIIFSLQDYNDPAFKVAEKIKGKYPEKDITLLVERCNAGLNPKVNNLIPAYRIAGYEYILISDSNVMVGKNYLREIVKPFKDPETGLVSNLIKGVGGYTLGSVFENLHLNSFIIGSVCFLDRFLKMPCVVGKSMLMRKSDFEAIGGFNAVKNVLAEDYIIGKKMHMMGKKVILSNYIIRNVNEYWGFRRFLNRHIRWGKLRWQIGGVKYLSELFNNPVFLSMFPVILEPSKLTIGFAALVSSLKVIGDIYIGRKVRADMNVLLFFLAPLKDLIIGIAWFVPLFSNTVVWRGNRYIIGSDSQLSTCPESGMFSWRYRLLDTIRTRLA
ncbi:MAG: ceramide glucosyltransferase [Thermodesulfovibrionales bacterium]|jgi:ceramide glucosyltransferase